ncbi:MAG: hypothetical protein VX583_09855 [Bdellovibrionota bacterium]|nr:hypothetical protein [Pseudobdellovibrionaceae bacterium]
MKIIFTTLFLIFSTLSLKAEPVNLCSTQLNEKQGGLIAKADFHFESGDLYYSSYWFDPVEKKKYAGIEPKRLLRSFSSCRYNEVDPSLVHCRNKDLSSLIVKLQKTQVINGSSSPVESYTKTLVLKLKREEALVFGDYDHRNFNCEVTSYHKNNFTELF